MTDLTWVDELPKLDLHHHLDGAIRTETMLELADEQGKDLPAGSVEELNQFVQVRPDCRNLSDFLSCFEVFYPLLQEPLAMERIARELCEDLEEQGVVYAETRFAPVLLTEEGSTMREHIDAVLDGLNRGMRQHDVTINLIVCVYRGTPAEASDRLVDLAAEYRSEGLVGVDLAGDERRYSADPHVGALSRARELGLPLTIHAGEAADADNVREAVELGASRIGHAVSLREDEALQEKVKENHIALELCLTSNLQTQSVSSLTEHPFRDFLNRGLEVTLNTDDPRVSNTDINREFRLAVKTFDLVREDVLPLLRSAVAASFATEVEQMRLTEKIPST